MNTVEDILSRVRGSLNTKLHEAIALKTVDVANTLLGVQEVCEECMLSTSGPDIFKDESGQSYYISLDEETLQERKIIIRVNSKGMRKRMIKCPAGRILKTVNGRKVCVTPSGRQKLKKKLAIRKSVRTKNFKGRTYKRRVTFKRNRAMVKRKQMGIKNQ